MSIDFTGDVFPLYATDVITDAEYLAVDSARRNQASEQAILTMIEVVRSYMAELRDDNEARIFHYAMGRMLAGVAYNTVYSNIVTRVVGNDADVYITADDGDTVTVTTASGTDVIVLSAAPYADVAAIVADVNGEFSNVTEVEAYVDGGKLGFRNTVGDEGVAFALAYGAGPSLLNKAGITAGEFFNPVEIVANVARDDALAHFERQGNPVAL